MDTEIWGPSAWLFIHSASLAYPESNPPAETRQQFRNFFGSLVEVLPCVYCRQHYKDNLAKMSSLDKALDSQASLFRWTVDLHNEVNKALGKEEWTYERAIRTISGRYQRRDYRRLFALTGLLGVAAVAVLLYLICRLKRKSGRAY